MAERGEPETVTVSRRRGLGQVETTMRIRRGMVHGLHFVEVEGLEVQSDKATPWSRDADGDGVIVSMDEIGGDRLAGVLESSNQHDLGREIGFRPFDETAAFAGHRVSFLRSDFDTDLPQHGHAREIAAWAATQVEAPANVDISFHVDARTSWSGVARGGIHARARTIRNGAERTVSRKLDPALPFEEAIAPILAYMERNCPRPAEGQAQLVCGTAVQWIVDQLTATGCAMLRSWMGRAADLSRDPGAFVVTEAVMREKDPARSVKLTRAEGGGTVLGNIALHGRLNVLDDDQGTSVTIAATVPDMVMASLKGRRVSDIVDRDWLSGLVVRTARDADGLTLRCSSALAPLTLPEEQPEDEADIVRQIDEITARVPQYRDFDEALRPMIEAMTPATLLGVLATLDTDRTVPLEDLGFPGWTIGAGGGRLTAIRSPSASLRALLGLAETEDKRR